ncbi:MAG: EamA family transporter [Acidimicrobiia bacterium]
MLAATVLALGSAFLHAGWNLFVKQSADRLIAAWGTLAAGGVVGVVALVALGLPPAAAVPYLIASTALHTGYALALVRAYMTTDFSVAYPVARGMAPLLAALGGVVLLADGMTPLGLVGAGLVTVSLIWIGLSAGGNQGVQWAVLTGLFITSYTLVDAAGVRSGDEAVRYVAALVALSTLPMTVIVLAARPWTQISQQLRSGGAPMAGAGVMAVVAYGMVLAAIRLAPVGYVATLRETSVIIGALAGWLFLGEALGKKRAMAGLVVVGGVALLALGV